MTDLLGNLLDTGERFARHELVEKRVKQLQPFYHLVAPPDGGPDAVFACDFGSDIRKQVSFLTVKTIAQKMGAIAVMFVGESWLVSTTAEEIERRDRSGQFVPPSQDPRRVEIVSLIASDGKTVRQRVLQIIRDKPGGKIISLIDEGNLDQGKFGGRMIDGIIS